jgi:hypothetical protein
METKTDDMERTIWAYCDLCGHGIDDDAGISYCPHCGDMLSIIYDLEKEWYGYNKEWKEERKRQLSWTDPMEA